MGNIKRHLSISSHFKTLASLSKKLYSHFSLKRTRPGLPWEVIFSDETVLSGTVAGGGTIASKFQTPPFSKIFSNSNILFCVGYKSELRFFKNLKTWPRSRVWASKFLTKRKKEHTQFPTSLPSRIRFGLFDLLLGLACSGPIRLCSLECRFAWTVRSKGSVGYVLWSGRFSWVKFRRYLLLLAYDLMIYRFWVLGNSVLWWCYCCSKFLYRLWFGWFVSDMCWCLKVWSLVNLEILVVECSWIFWREKGIWSIHPCSHFEKCLYQYQCLQSLDLTTLFIVDQLGLELIKGLDKNTLKRDIKDLVTFGLKKTKTK